MSVTGPKALSRPKNCLCTFRHVCNTIKRRNPHISCSAVGYEILSSIILFLIYRHWKVRRGYSSLKLNYTITYNINYEEVTRELSIDDLMKVRLKLNCVTHTDSPVGEGKSTTTLSISTAKHDLAKCSTIKLNIVSNSLNFFREHLNVPDYWSDWQLMGSGECKFYANLNIYSIMFDLHIHAYEVKIPMDTVSLKLYADTDFTDFCLSSSEGNVAVHKSFLAAHSDVFKTMLSGEWKETAEGKINIEGGTLQTLQDLKDYMYLGTLPDDGLCPLLLIARRYLMEELEKQCIRKLADRVVAEDLYSLIQFSCENNIPELAYAILHITQDRVVGDAHIIRKANLQTQ